jgi:hypothetical protein
MGAYIADARRARDLFDPADAWTRKDFGVMKSALKWESALLITYGPYEIPTESTFVLDARYLVPEKQLLIEALEWWLADWRWDEDYDDEDD